MKITNNYAVRYQATALSMLVEFRAWKALAYLEQRRVVEPEEWRPYQALYVDPDKPREIDEQFNRPFDPNHCEEFVRLGMAGKLLDNTGGAIMTGIDNDGEESLAEAQHRLAALVILFSLNPKFKGLTFTALKRAASKEEILAEGHFSKPRSLAEAAHLAGNRDPKIVVDAAAQMAFDRDGIVQKYREMSALAKFLPYARLAATALKRAKGPKGVAVIRVRRIANGTVASFAEAYMHYPGERARLDRAALVVSCNVAHDPATEQGLCNLRVELSNPKKSSHRDRDRKKLLVKIHLVSFIEGVKINDLIPKYDENDNIVAPSKKEMPF